MFLSQSGHLLNDATEILQDRKFDTALRKSTVTAFINRKDCQHHWSDDLIWIHHPNADNYQTDTTLLPSLILWITDPLTTLNRSGDIKWSKIWSVLETNLTIQHSWTSQSLSPKINKCNRELFELLHKYGRNMVVNRLVQALSEVNEIINQLPQVNKYVKGCSTDQDLLNAKSQLNRAYSKPLDLSATWNNRICILEWQGAKWILPKAYILQIHNKIADIISILLYAIGATSICHTRDFYTDVLDFIRLMCREHVRCPQLYFDLANSIEGLCVGQLLKKTEGWVNDDLWNTLINELDELYFRDMSDHPLIRLITDVPIETLTEISCLTKVTGHPLTDIKEGGYKLQSRVQEEFDVSPDAIAFCISSFKENFVRNFIMKHKRWPHISFNPDTCCELIQYCYPRGLDPKSEEVVRRFGRLKWEDWAMIDLQPELKFNYCENVIPLLKDKALSLCRSKVFQTYLAETHGPVKDATGSKKTRVPFQETRVLLHYLFTSDLHTDHKDYIQRCMAEEDDLESLRDYLVIRLVPKEKELKTKPRFFGCKTFLDRARSIVQETNTMTYLNLFSDEQGMSLSELALMRKLYSMQNINKLYRTHKVFCISFDAEAWNHRHRLQTIKPFCQHTLDPLFGVNIFSRTHDFYQKSLVYIPDEEDSMFWDGQLGGIEGLNQNTWVTAYIHQMRYAFRDTAYKFHQLIHGDDYRVVVMVPLSSIPEGGEKEIVDKLKNHVNAAASAFGHKIKVKESYASEHIMCYSKIIFYKTIQLPSALRKIQKVYGATNAFLPILDDYIGSTFSNAHSACYTTVIHYVPYIVALFWSCYYLFNNSIYNELSLREIEALLLVPSTVGGMPIIYLHNMWVRGESDLLCAFVSLCQHCLIHFPDIGALMVRFLQIPYSVNKPFSLLLKDPYSLPIRRPQSISLYLKAIIKKRLSTTVRNKHIRDLLFTYDKTTLEVLIDDLKSVGYWPAKPNTALYSASPYHLIDELTAGFVTAKSIMDLLLVSSKNVAQSQRILKRAIKKDEKHQKWRVSVLQGKIMLTNRVIDPNECPVVICDRIRHEAWGLPITTITHPPPQHQVSFGTQEDLSNSLWALDNHFSLNIHKPTFLNGQNRWHYADGGKIPFLGHTTSAGTLVPDIQVSEKDPIASKVSNLLTLRSWMNRSTLGPHGPITSNFPAHVDKILRCYTNQDPAALQKFAPAWKSGSVTHRLRAHGFRESVVPNNLYNLYTLMTGETNTHRHFRETRDDFTVNYLHLFCYGLIVVFLDLEFGPTHHGPSVVWMVTTDCPQCNTPIVEPPVVIEQQHYLLQQLPVLHLTDLGQASEALIRMAQEEYDIAYPTLHTISDEDLGPYESRCVLIYECLKKAWYERMALSRRYGIHDMTGQGLGLMSGLSGLRSEKTLGETELRALPLANVLDTLATYILHFILKEIKKPYKVDINARFNTIIPSQLPWYPLIEWYYKAGLLRALIRQAFILVNVPPHEGTYYNVSTATIYLGKTLACYALETSPQFFIIPGTLSDTVETLYRRYLMIYTREIFSDMKRNHQQCRIRLEGVKPHMLDVEEALHIVRSYIIYSRDPMPIDVFSQQNRVNQGTFAFMLQGATEYTDEEWEKAAAERPPPWFIHFNHLHWGLFHASVNLITEDEIQNLINEDPIIETPYQTIRYPVGACIDIVRSNPHYADKGFGQDPIAELDPRDIPLRENLRLPPNALAIPITTEYVTNPIRTRITFNKIHEPPKNFCWSNVARILGSSISSCNKFHYLLDLFGMLDLHYQEGVITTVAEGEGGTLHYLLSFYRESTAIFNTYIDDQRSGASAGICDKDPRTSHRYACQPLRQGIGDLQDWSTAQINLNLYPQKTWLYTCDADVRECTSSEIYNLWMNVSNWWLLRRTRNGVFILKVFYDHPSEIIRLCTFLSYYCLYVRLVRVPISHINTELYVVAFGTAHVLTERDTRPWGEHPQVAASIRTFLQRQYDIYNRRKHEYDPEYQRECVATLFNHSTFYAPHHGLLLYIITQKLRLPLDPRYRDGVTHPEDIITILQYAVMTEKADIHERLQENRGELRTYMDASATLMHKYHMILRYMYLEVYASMLKEDLYECIKDQREWRHTPTEFSEYIITLIQQIDVVPIVFAPGDRGPIKITIGNYYEIDIYSIIHHGSAAVLQLMGILSLSDDNMPRRVFIPNEDDIIRDEIDAMFELEDRLPADDELPGRQF